MQYLSPFPGFSKTLILSRREEELRHAVKNNLDAKKIRRAAERVRAAKLQLLKALPYASEPCSSNPGSSESPELQKLKSDAEYWERRLISEIIDEYAHETHTS